MIFGLNYTKQNDFDRTNTTITISKLSYKTIGLHCTLYVALYRVNCVFFCFLFCFTFDKTFLKLFSTNVPGSNDRSIQFFELCHRTDKFTLDLVPETGSRAIRMNRHKCTLVCQCVTICAKLFPIPDLAQTQCVFFSCINLTLYGGIVS